MVPPETDDECDCVLLGASVRALACSAVWAGAKPLCIDLFADADLRRIARTRKLPLSKYPRGFAEFADLLDGRPWLYTGGLENHPELIRHLATRGQLLGNDASVLRAVRDPQMLQAALAEIDLAMPGMQRGDHRPHDVENWLWKPFRGSGGMGIVPAADAPFRTTAGYFQQREPGEPHSAVYIGDGSSAELVGVSRQLVGESFCNAPPFRYCGSVGPIRVPAELTATLEELGFHLASKFHLRGLFGVDFLRRGNEISVLEVNPRYPASAEVFELARRWRAFRSHRRAFGEANPVEPTKWRDKEVVSKAVLFAKDHCQLRADAPCFDPGSQITGSPFATMKNARAYFADVSEVDTEFSAGEPVVTLLVKDHSHGSAIERTKSAVSELIR